MHYRSWSSLSKAKLVFAANRYVADRAPGNEACIYAVECRDGRATLRLIKSVEMWDLEAARQLAWDRRFRLICPGRTANFGLAVATDTREAARTPYATRHAVWSFANDRFVPVLTRFSSASFSEGEPEPCTSAYAVTGRRR